MGKPATTTNRHAVTPTSEDMERNRAAMALVESWLRDESGYDESVFPELKRALEESRRALGARPPFDAD